MDRLIHTIEEVKANVSGIDISFDLANAASSFETAQKDVQDAVGRDIWNIAVAHRNGTDYLTNEQEDPYLALLDRLVAKLQKAVANFALFHHFIWLQIRVSNNGITIPDSDSEKQAYRYQTDEAKEELIKAAWAAINEAITFMNENAVKWQPWITATAYAIGDVIKHEGSYFTCTEAHTSGVFADDTAKWEATADEAVYLREWTNSEQYATAIGLVFEGERDFSKFFNIENSAYFYYKIVYVIEEVIEDEIKPRIEGWAEITQRYMYGKPTEADKTLLRKVKKATAYRAMAEAIARFMVHELPAPIRAEIAENEAMKRAKTGSTASAKSTVGAPIHHKGEKYLMDLDMYLDTLAQIEADAVADIAPTQWEDDTHTTEDDKFVSL